MILNLGGVHGDIRHLETSSFRIIGEVSVHGDIRHLEIYA